jgi:hypothetical protein
MALSNALNQPFWLLLPAKLSSYIQLVGNFSSLSGGAQVGRSVGPYLMLELPLCSAPPLEFIMNIAMPAHRGEQYDAGMYVS